MRAYFLLINILTFSVLCGAQNFSDIARPLIFELAFSDDQTRLDSFGNVDRFEHVAAGNLLIESGKLTLGDPIYIHKAIPLDYTFKQGSFRVEFAFVKDSTEYANICYVRVLLSNRPVHRWDLIKDFGKDTSTRLLYNFTAYSESGILLDSRAVKLIQTLKHSNWENIFIETLNNTQRPSWMSTKVKNSTVFGFRGFDSYASRVYIGRDIEEKACRLLIETGMYQLHPSRF